MDTLDKSTEVKRDKPWLIRTYSGHSSAKASNALYRTNLAKGQTGLSVAFDLPTQTGYDADHPLARGEVGKVGVPICSIEDMEKFKVDFVYLGDEKIHVIKQSDYVITSGDVDQ